MQREKRHRAVPSRFDFDDLSNEEQTIIQRALINSRKELKRMVLTIPEGPVFHPTIDEFKDPVKYINSITSVAERYGICKIVPPEGWNPQCRIDERNTSKMGTKRQPIHELQEGNGFDDGSNYTLEEYKAQAQIAFQTWKNKYYREVDEIPMAELERDYWDIVETRKEELIVDYANDLHTPVYGSGFPTVVSGDYFDKNGSTDVSGIEADDCSDMFSEQYYERTGWNVNNMPIIVDSLLHHLKIPINGVNVPWLYVGSLFASFCWHTEDNYLYSINYHHFGAVKQWYGCPGAYAAQFEKIAKEQRLLVFQDSPDILHHMTMQMSPSTLLARAVPVCQIKQEPGTFMITFPKAFHAGFSYGYNCGEAVNFALPRWIPFGEEAVERYRVFGRESVMSYDRLLFTLYRHKQQLSHQALLILINQLDKIINEDITMRKQLETTRGFSGVKALGHNSFEKIDDKMATYDSLRECSACKHSCLFSAVICKCSDKKVSCLRHAHLMCSCPPATNNILLTWASKEELVNKLLEMAQLKHELLNKKIKPEASINNGNVDHNKRKQIRG